MPTPAQVERSRKRNRERGYDRKFIEGCQAKLTDADRIRLLREQQQGPEYSPPPGDAA